MDLFKRIQDLSAVYDDDGPSAMVPESRPMFNDGGMLVKPSADGSRPGYAGVTGKTKKKTLSKEKLNVLNEYSQEIFGQDYDKLTKPDDVSKVYNTAVNRNRGMDTFKYRESSRNNPLPKEQKNKLIKFAKANNIKLNFNENPRFGVPAKIKNKPGINQNYQKILDSYNNYDFEIFKKDTLNPQQRNFVMDNFELPKGVKNWDFDNFKFGINSTKYRAVQKRIKTKLDGPIKYTIAVDRSAPKGWMTAAMERVYKNQTILLKDGSRGLKKGVDKLTYEPVFKKGTNNIIIGFKDNTPSGQGLTYYGLNKNTPEGAASWSEHKDYNKVDKFLKIAKGAQVDDPSKLLQKILDDKGITKLMGDRSVLTLNDILSHERYYNKISEIKPTKLLESQIVKHHIGGVGAGDVARANATRDIQLLTGAVNKKITSFESKLIKDGFLSKADNDILKNLGAKIRGADGKIYGGGYIDPEKQFAAIEKGALKYAQSKDFNVKSVASYLERLGCGKAAGGRVYYNEGAFGLTKCAQKGQRVLAEGLEKGFKKGTQATLATAILKAGKGLKDVASIRGLLGPAALSFIAAEQAAYVGYDMLSKGKSFKEAIGDSAFNYLAGDKTKVDPIKERNKRMIEEGMTPEQMGKIGAMESTFDRINYGNSLLNKIEDAKQGQLDEMSESSDFSYLPNRTDEFKKQEDDARTNLREFYRGDTNFGADIEGGQEALAEGLRRNELAQLQSVDNIFQSKKGDDYRTARKRELMLQNPDILNYMGQYPTTLGFAGGGIANLAGVDKGPPPESGPNSQGLQGLFNRVKKV